MDFWYWMLMLVVALVSGCILWDVKKDRQHMRELEKTWIKK